ncbi:two-component response regulator ORR21-like [Primulina huaijiensis]|uniref:two-component response regulator ORR21-like n=1 Tax=Primulina huaijiensis TaxID=1492673 RepID=UPI003CC76B49
MACASGGKLVVPEQFPAGLRVLVVDDDLVCLRVLEQMLRKCVYNVTSCSQATVALKLLRERKGCYDIVLSDVHMPDMDGFRLLELVGLEMDLPVIMISADGRTDLVMRGIRHGACDYLIKPIRDEELKNIWQHVVRKRWNGNKEPEHSDSLDDSDRNKRAGDDAEYGSSVNEGGDGVLKSQKKRRETKDDDSSELENDDPTMAKKPRVVWSVDLHQQFVSAVNQLGIDKAVPKRILELMNVPGLTRENVASHLQKFRLYLKRLSGVAQQQGGLPSSYCGPLEQNPILASIGRFDIQTLAASGQLPPQTLAAIHADFLSRPAGNLVLSAMDQPALLHASLQGPKCIPVDQNVAYVQPLIRCSSNIIKQISLPLMSNEDGQSEFRACSSKDISDVVPACNNSSVVEANGNMSTSFVQQQQQQRRQHQLEQQRQSIMLEPSRSINVQASCLVVPSQSSANFQPVNSPASVNQNLSFGNTTVDYNNPSVRSNNQSGFGQILDLECKPALMLSEFSAPGSVTSASSCTKNAEGSLTNVHYMQSLYGGKTNRVIDQESIRNPVYVSKGTSIPSRFAVDVHEYPLGNINRVKFYAENNSNKVKQEPNMDFTDNVKVGIPVRQHFPQMI